MGLLKVAFSDYSKELSDIQKIADKLSGGKINDSVYNRVGGNFERIYNDAKATQEKFETENGGLAGENLQDAIDFWKQDMRPPAISLQEYNKSVEEYRNMVNSGETLGGESLGGQSQSMEQAKSKALINSSFPKLIDDSAA